MTTDDDRDDFLGGRARYAMLSTLRADGSPVTVPVWFAWDGQIVSMFSAITSTKLTRIERDPRVSVLVSNEVDEPEYWVSFDGQVRIEESGGFELAEQLAGRYWDLSDPERVHTLELWRSFADVGFRRLVLEPSRIRTYQPDQPPEPE